MLEFHFLQLPNVMGSAKKALSEVSLVLLTKIWVKGGNFTPCWFCLNNLEKVKVSPLKLAAVNNVLLETFV